MGAWGVLVGTADENDGFHPRLLAFLAPDGEGPPMHVHPEAAERFEVIAGELTLVFEDGSRTLGPGSEYTVEPGVENTFRNDAEGVTAFATPFPSSIDVETRYTLWGLDHEDELVDGRPGHRQATVMNEAMRRSTQYTIAPLSTQKLLWSCSVQSPGSSVIGRTWSGT